MQLEKAYCLREPSGGGSQPYLCYPVAFMGGQGAKARSIDGIDRADTAGCNGRGFRTGEMYTLNTVDRPEVCYPETARALTARYDSSYCVDRGQNVVALDCRSMTGNAELSGTLQAKNNGGHSLNYMNPVVYAQQRIGQYVQDKIGSTEMARDYKSAKDLIVESAEPPRKYIVRRLTPTECARLQGFPDEWCEGLGGSDGAIYKAYGNGLALPCAYDVLSRIAKEMEANE